MTFLPCRPLVKPTRFAYIGELFYFLYNILSVLLLFPKKMCISRNFQNGTSIVNVTDNSMSTLLQPDPPPGRRRAGVVEF